MCLKVDHMTVMCSSHDCYTITILNVYQMHMYTVGCYFNEITVTMKAAMTHNELDDYDP